MNGDERRRLRGERSAALFVGGPHHQAGPHPEGLPEEPTRQRPKGKGDPPEAQNEQDEPHRLHGGEPIGGKQRLHLPAHRGQRRQRQAEDEGPAKEGRNFGEEQAHGALDGPP